MGRVKVKVTEEKVEVEGEKKVGTGGCCWMLDVLRAGLGLV